VGNENDPQRVRFAPARTGWTAAAVAVHGVLLFGLLGALVAVVPRFEETYRDYRMTLPAMTQSAIALSNFCKNYFFALAGIAAGLVYGDWMLYGWLRRNCESPAGSRTWFLLVTVALIGCCLWLVLALFIPFPGLMQNIGS